MGLEINQIQKPTSGVNPEAEPVKLLPDKAQLSPVSEVAKRMVGCSLKRVAEDPESPGPVKKRKLFPEETPPPQGGMKLKGQKRNVHKVKKEIRVKAKQVGTPQDAHHVGEIDFPAAWLGKMEGKEESEIGKDRVDGSGGCPSTATRAP